MTAMHTYVAASSVLNTECGHRRTDTDSGVVSRCPALGIRPFWVDVMNPPCLVWTCEEHADVLEMPGRGILLDPEDLEDEVLVREIMSR